MANVLFLHVWVSLLLLQWLLFHQDYHYDHYRLQPFDDLKLFSTIV